VAFANHTGEMVQGIISLQNFRGPIFPTLQASFNFTANNLKYKAALDNFLQQDISQLVDTIILLFSPYIILHKCIGWIFKPQLEIVPSSSFSEFSWLLCEAKLNLFNQVYNFASRIKLLLLLSCIRVIGHIVMS